MEPISVLSLVASVIQVVDAAAKAYNICHEIYTRGATIEDSRMTYTSGQLLDSYSVLVSEHAASIFVPSISTCAAANILAGCFTQAKPQWQLNNL